MNNYSTEEEIWKDVTDFEGLYQVSNLGRVKSLDRLTEHKNGKIVPKKGRFLKPDLSGGNYGRVTLRDKDFSKRNFVHRLVAFEFLGNPFKGDASLKGKTEVNHKDGNTLNNALTNLEWVTKSENMLHARENGFTTHGSINGRAVLDERDVSVIRRLYDKGVTQQVLADAYGVSRGNISAIVTVKTWTR